MLNLLSSRNTTTDATGIIPARLGVGALTAVFVGTGGLVTVPTIELPSWIPILIEEQVTVELMPDRLEPISIPEANVLMQLDESHNPLLADLWRDEVNDDLVDNP